MPVTCRVVLSVQIDFLLPRIDDFVESEARRVAEEAFKLCEEGGRSTRAPVQRPFFPSFSAYFDAARGDPFNRAICPARAPAIS